MPAKSSRAGPGDDDDDTMTDAQWNEYRRLLYERKRLKGKQLRQADIARRKARELPPSLLELIERHVRAQPRIQRHTLAPIRFARPLDVKLAEVVSEVIAADPALLTLSEAAALSPEERMQTWGWLFGLPYGAAMPKYMLDPDYRPELPRWCLSARYDCGIRDDNFVALLDGRVDQATLDKQLGDPKYFNPYSAPSRSLRPDEVGLGATERAHLKKLRDKLKRAQDYLTNAGRYTKAGEAVDKARSYVTAAEAAIRAARVSYQLPADEPPQAST